MKYLIFALTLILPLTSTASEVCDQVNSSAELNQIYTDKTQSGYVVIGHGRLYFHTSPNSDCIEKKIFLVKGDLVNTYAEYNGFSSIIYFKKNGESVEGWVESNRLRSTGTGIGPK